VQSATAATWGISKLYVARQQSRLNIKICLTEEGNTQDIYNL